MDRWYALGKPGYGFPSSTFRFPSGSFLGRPSCCHGDCFAKAWGLDSSGRPIHPGRNSCSRRGIS
eukprot:3048735-Alexandrium_andersonii.AAC.1